MQVRGGNEIAIFRVPPDEGRDIGAERDDAKLIGAGEVERCPSKFGGQAFALQGLRNFSMV